MSQVSFLPTNRINVFPSGVESNSDKLAEQIIMNGEENNTQSNDITEQLTNKTPVSNGLGDLEQLQKTDDSLVMEARDTAAIEDGDKTTTQDDTISASALQSSHEGM